MSGHEVALQFWVVEASKAAS